MIVFGKQVCLYVLEKHKEIIEEIYFNKEIEKFVFRAFSSLQKPIVKLDFKKMQALTKGGNHQGFALKVAKPAQFGFKFFQDSSRIAVLVGLSDVGNIGSIFRSAVAFGINGVILTNNFDESGVARASSGAFFDMPFMIYKDYLSLINELKMSKFVCVGTSINGDLEFRNSDKWALFLGSEGFGLPNKALKKMDIIYSIKIKNFDSLNVSVAAGILMDRMVNYGMY